MTFQSSPLDIMSLPPNVIEMILTHLPMRDAFRTSILSQNWRYRCVSIPKLVFDDTLFQGSTRNQLSVKCKLLHVVYPILLLHQGPILEFALSISQLHGCCEIDQIILHLLRNNAVEKLTLCISSGNDYKLPSSFFSLQRLVHLKLGNCAFQPTSTFDGFSRLTCLCFDNVSITTKMLLRFLSSCPLLRSFSLTEDDAHFVGGGNSDFVELLECLPLIEHLHMSCYPVKCFAAGGVPQKPPTSLVPLRVLSLSGLSFVKEDELSSLLFLITISPKIEKITMQMHSFNPNEAVSQTVMNLLELHVNHSHVTWDHLRELEISNFNSLNLGPEFVRLILAKSPMLQKVRIGSNSQRVGVNDEVRILRELLRFPRASAKAEIIFERI